MIYMLSLPETDLQHTSVDGQVGPNLCACSEADLEQPTRREAWLPLNK